MENEPVAVAMDGDAEEKVAHPLELFFDLVFVFAFTQVVGFIVHDFDLDHILKGMLILGIVWWSWSNWTWMTNVVDLEPRFTRLKILLAMFGVFAMAFAIPHAFGEDAVPFALGYFFVSILSAVSMWWGTRHLPEEQAAIKKYAPVAALGPVLIVVGAFVGGDAQQWWWWGGFVFGLAATALAGQSDWEIDAGHFAERHGLIMIIALGEAIIAIGVALSGDDVFLSKALALQLGIGLAGACAMWWAYFDRMQEVWEAALHYASKRQRSLLARDVYTLLHYPMIVGIVFMAVALEEAFHHADEPMPAIVGNLFIAGVAMLLLAMAAATWRCWRTYMYERVAGVVVVAIIVRAFGLNADVTLLLATIVIVVSLAIEYLRFRDVIRGDAAPIHNDRLLKD